MIPPFRSGVESQDRHQKSSGSPHLGNPAAAAGRARKAAPTRLKLLLRLAK
jgi:hypothetical protein